MSVLLTWLVGLHGYSLGLGPSGETRPVDPVMGAAERAASRYTVPSFARNAEPQMSKVVARPAAPGALTTDIRNE